MKLIIIICFLLQIEFNYAQQPDNSKLVNNTNTVLAEQITYGTSLTDSISQIGEIDQYTFSATANDVITIQMTGSSSLQPAIEVYSPTGEKLIREVGDALSPLNAKIDTLKLLQSGTYTILAMASLGNATGAYGLSLQLVSSPGSGTAIQYGITVQDTLEQLAEMDSYTFNATANDIVTIQMSSSNNNSYNAIEVYSTTGQMLIREAGSVAVKVDTLKLLQSGTYTILAMNYYGNAYEAFATGEYGLSLQLVSFPSLGTAIQYGITVQDTLEQLAEMDSYIFSATANDVITIQMTGSSSLQPAIEVYSPTGEKLIREVGDALSPLNAKIDTLKLLQSGTYTILAMASLGNATGAYGLSLQLVSSPGSGTAIQYGITVQDTLEQLAEMDSYTFNATANDIVTIQMSSSNNNSYNAIEVYSTTGQMLIREAGSVAVKVDTLKLLQSGTYTILAMNYYGNAYEAFATGEYGLSLIGITIQNSITVFAPNGGENWTVESDQNIAWTSYNVINVKLEYSTDNGINWSTIITSTPASSGSYNWIVPNTPSTQCKVKISDVDSLALYDESNNVFTISTPQPILTVTPDERNVSNASGTTTFSVSNTGTGTMNWTAESDTGWADITSGVSGTDSGTITVSYEENTDIDQRSATITVTSEGVTGSPKLVMINQNGTALQPILTVTPDERNVSNESGTTTFSVSNTGTGTMNWTAISDTGWAVITGDTSGTNSGTITVSYEENTDINQRTATITVTSTGATGSPKLVTVNQNGTATQPILTVTPDERNVSNVSGTTTFSVSNTGTGTMNWTAISDTGWAVITGDTSGTNSGTITVSYEENTDINQRTATITVTSTGATGSPKLVTVNQNGTATQPILTVTPDERNVSNVSGTTTFLVSNTGTGTMNWTAESDVAWAVITDGSSGTNDDTISIDYSANQSTSQRSATITITTTGATGSPMTANINQSGIVQPSTLTLNYTVNYPSYSNPSDYRSTDYRLIGIPGNSSKKINEFITGTQGENWEIYWDNGNSMDYYVKLDNSDNFLCSPGKAFWLINTGNWSLNNVSVSSSPLDAQNFTTISISSNKFNLITNPYLVNVAWSDIMANNQVLTKQPAYWTGSVLGLADTLKPYVGYLLDNTNSNITEIKIPYLPAGLGKRSANADSWRINIELESGNYTDKTTVLGVSPGASKTIDKFDMIKPRIMGEMPHLFFDRPDWDGEHNEWGSDIRSNIKGIESWDFIAYVKDKTGSNIKVNNIQLVPDEFEVYLIDETTAKVQNLRNNPNYSFTPKVNKARMYVLVGEKNLVQKEIEKYIPTKFELLSNYPNPFNPATTIPVVIPEKSNVKLEVYNILGQKVETIYNGELDQGIHYFDWNSNSLDAGRLSSGVYIYRLQAENRINISRKMVLLK